VAGLLDGRTGVGGVGLLGRGRGFGTLLGGHRLRGGNCGSGSLVGNMISPST
jgi:hypothetical protein